MSHVTLPMIIATYVALRYSPEREHAVKDMALHGVGNGSSLDSVTRCVQGQRSSRYCFG